MPFVVEESGKENVVPVRHLIRERLGFVNTDCVIGSGLLNADCVIWVDGTSKVDPISLKRP